MSSRPSLSTSRPGLWGAKARAFSNNSILVAAPLAKLRLPLCQGLSRLRRVYTGAHQRRKYSSRLPFFPRHALSAPRIYGAPKTADSRAESSRISSLGSLAISPSRYFSSCQLHSRECPKRPECGDPTTTIRSSLWHYSNTERPKAIRTNPPS